MNIHEYQAKQLFRDFSIPVPSGFVAHSPQQAVEMAGLLAGQAWVLKAQIHAGARGKAGGVKVVRKLEDVYQNTAELLGSRLVTHQTDSAGLPVNSVLVEEASAINKEFYLSLLVDRETERLLFIASAAGGMDIEQVAAESPEKIVRVAVHPAAGLQAYQVRLVAAALGLGKEQQAHHEYDQPHDQGQTGLGPLLILKLTCPLQAIMAAVKPDRLVNPRLDVSQILRQGAPAIIDPDGDLAFTPLAGNRALARRQPNMGDLAQGDLRAGGGVEHDTTEFFRARGHIGR